MTTVLIDNYDSFTWNVYQYLCSAGANVVVFRNDKTTVEHVASLNPKNIVISPGPGHPSDDVGISKDVIRHFAGKIPILGVCLGEQCMFEIFGGEVTFAGEIVHGKISKISHDGKGLYHGVPQGIAVTRYHSLAGNPSFIPDDLVVTSRTDSGIIMGVRHKEYCIEGVQYHPESILSEHGMTLIENFLNCRGGTWAENPELEATSTLTKTEEGNSGKSQTILEKIHVQRLADIAEAKATPGRSEAQLKKLLDIGIAPPLIDLVSRLRQGPRKPAVMAEIKRASPSKGDINVDAIAAEQALLYAEAGAAVISVLTEPKWFKGSLQDLRQARESISRLPNRPAILRKDFIIDTYQIMEARLEGADTVLLIVAMLEDEKLQELMRFSRSLGMEPLVEVNNAAEMKKALEFGAKVIGVNNRNLHTFDVDMENTSRLAEMVPEDVILAALSGITGPQDVAKYIEQGVGAVLIGEALMRSQDKKKFIHDLTQAEASVPISQQSPPLVKICGVRTVEAAVEAAKAGADFIGLIFAPSKRQVSIDDATKIVDALRTVSSELPSSKVPVPSVEGKEWFRFHADNVTNGKKPLVVGVFQNQSVDYITSVVQQVKLDLVQLHGDEPAETARFLPVRVIKAFHIDNTFSNFNELRRPGHNAFTLLDAKVDTKQLQGGSGVTFDWRIAQKFLENSVNREGDQFPILLAGGLTPENVQQAVNQVRPWGVDVSSGVETDGVKDLQKIREFVKRAKNN
ncbi:N-anthranilate isomerase [Basidiobolus meristosporus CBS 931.73]|uniref:Multifunctional tryptophan biosynthesis protein n=1 Tax=Basidiobolus meristosporus CBS 931.73 TaxID=1314790 RepID=A0A1Y1YH67_9FUNG|nr:N-anthranilate isomerase [Basidiobolus meristosporus CBS 931.73]|eukprot:ORX97335.1 N-anthranilate isomerase [Basidiobolus meristosporus CBS 931.73]